MRKWKENIKEKLIIINENNLFIPSNKKEDYDILIEKNLENKKKSKKVKNLKEQKLNHLKHHHHYQLINLKYH